METADNENNPWQSDRLCENELVQDADGLGLLIEDIDPEKNQQVIGKQYKQDESPHPPSPLLVLKAI